MLVLMTQRSDIRDDDHQFKYPWICCEIFRLNILPLIGRLFENDFKYLRSYTEILDRKPPLDNLQAEYYSRIISKLLETKSEKTLEFIFKVENYFTKIVNHIENGSILNLFQSLIDALCIEVEDKGELPGMIIESNIPKGGEEDKEEEDDDRDRNYRVKKALDDKNSSLIVKQNVIKGLMQQIGPDKSILVKKKKTFFFFVFFLPSFFLPLFFFLKKDQRKCCRSYFSLCRKDCPRFSYQIGVERG